MTKIVKMDGYEIHHPKTTLKNKVNIPGGIPLKEMEKRMAKKMGALTDQFLSGIPSVIQTIETALNNLENGKGQETDQATLYRQGHDLKGMGGSFGYPIMGAIGGGICELTDKSIKPSALRLSLIRVHLDLLTYVAVNRIKDDKDPNAAPILSSLENARQK